MAAADAAWIVAQRWFRAKHRPIRSVTHADRIPLGSVELEVLEVAYADGGAADHYLVPTIDGREPTDGEGAWTAIVRAMATRRATRRARSVRLLADGGAGDLLPSAHEAVVRLTSGG